MKSHYIYFVLFSLFEWCNTTGLFRINTARDSTAYMHSFQPPLGEKLFHWNTGADASLTPDYVQLTPATQGSTGIFWNTKKANMMMWEAVFDFQLAGRTDMGGDGFAFWYTDQMGLVGPVYGSNDYWNGLGVFFDTYDNDREDENPLISVCINDGTQSYDNERDGAANALGSCSFKIRNTQNRISAKVRFVSGHLTLQIAINYDVLGLPIYEHCVEIKKANIAPDGFFGMSSHTGDLADSHRIYSMTVKDLSPVDENLIELKKKWLESQEALHQKESDMTQSAFKHIVLQKLRQAQEEIDMIETSTLVDANEIKEGLKMVSLLEVLLNNLFNQFRAKMNDEEINIGDTMDFIGADPMVATNIETDLQKIRQVVSNLNKVTRQAAGSGSNMPNKILQLTNQISSITREFEYFRQLMDNAQSQFNKIVMKLASQNEKIQAFPSASSKGSSWWSYFIVALITAPLGGVLTHFCKPKAKKYNAWDN